MEVSDGGGCCHPVLSVCIIEQAMNRFLIFPEGGHELEAWCSR
jgi:hypothetical protein